MLQRSHTFCTLSRRVISPGFSSPPFSTVCRRRPHLHVRQLVLTKFARFILGALVVLFFKCVAALFNPVHRRGEPIKWGLVSYTLIMFSLVTVETAMIFDLRSISYIDNRGFSGGDLLQIPGPYGYQFFVSLDPISIIPATVLILSNWLADGHLVGSFFDSPRCLTQDPLPALSLLSNLLHELLGNRLSLSHLPRFYWCVFYSSTSRQHHSRLTSTM